MLCGPYRLKRVAITFTAVWALLAIESWKCHSTTELPVVGHHSVDMARHRKLMISTEIKQLTACKKQQGLGDKQ